MSSRKHPVVEAVNAIAYVIFSIGFLVAIGVTVSFVAQRDFWMAGSFVVLALMLCCSMAYMESKLEREE